MCIKGVGEILVKKKSLFDSYFTLIRFTLGFKGTSYLQPWSAKDFSIRMLADRWVKAVFIGLMSDQVTLKLSFILWF